MTAAAAEKQHSPGLETRRWGELVQFQRGRKDPQETEEAGQSLLPFIK